VTATPALVTPLPKRNTHIHPPSNTWCRAAASSGYGGVLAVRIGELRHRVAAGHAGEVAVERLRGREAAEAEAGLVADHAAHEAPRSGGVHQGARRQMHARAAPLPGHGNRRAGRARLQPVERHLVEILRAEREGFVDEERVHVRAQPVRVRHAVGGARCDEQLVGAIGRGAVRRTAWCLK
jgi:hypothetical protein